MSYEDLQTFDPFEIIVGTYEQFLLGYKVQNVVNEYKIEKSFATHSHLASIRSVTSSKHYLASAGADDTVCLYDMRYRIDCGKLMHHNDTVNCVAFTPEGSHLFTCSSDGSITALRCGSWQTEKCWPSAHKSSAVNTLAIHPTGKLALSTGTDGVLRTWNLVKGRQAYAINLIPTLKYDAKNIMIVKWSPDGVRYLLAVNQKIDIYSVETAGIEKTFTFDSKVICVEFLKDDLIAIGFEDGQIKFYDLKTSKQTLETVAHNIRVKCIAHINDLLVSASSVGEIKLWKYNRQSLDMLQTVNCGARITCLSLTLPCENLVSQKQESSEEKKETKVINRYRLKQEVIIEDEESNVTSVTNLKKKASKTKHKTKRVLEDTEDTAQNLKKKVRKSKDVIDAKKKRTRSLENDDIVVRKKKMLKTNEKSAFNKKRKEDSVVSLPSKKFKKVSEFKRPPVIREKREVKLPLTANTEDIIPKKKGKISSLGGIKKKKRRTVK